MQSDTKSFILRIWVESETEEDIPSKWRGVVEQVGSPKRLYFQDLARAFSFVQEQAGIDMRSTTNHAWWKSIIGWIRNAIHIHRDKQNNPPEESDRD